MPNVEYLHGFVFGVNPVVDPKGRVEELAHVVMRLQRGTHGRKLSEKIDVVQKCGYELLGALWMILERPRFYSLKIR
jgi:hypothetical protein